MEPPKIKRIHLDVAIYVPEDMEERGKEILYQIVQDLEGNNDLFGCIESSDSDAAFVDCDEDVMMEWWTKHNIHPDNGQDEG